MHNKSYNERLFSGGIRGYFHFARFHWFRNELKKLGARTDSVLELGCYDCRLVEYLPAMPKRYIGADANWEGGLDLAKKKYGSVPGFSFAQVESPDAMELGNERFDLIASLETLEHVPPELVDGFLAKFAKHLNGYLLVTVPNETGPVFLAKWIVKSVFGMSAKDYSVSELFYAFIGRTDRVRRQEHKGFNYRSIEKQIRQHFDVINTRGFPLSFLPTWLCFGVGISAQPKR